MKSRDLIMKARCRLLAVEPWYGTMAALMEWQETRNIVDGGTVDTAGVAIRSDGRIQAIYNPNFFDNMTVEQGMGVIKHEIEHIVLMHCVRVMSRHPRIWNIATDMVINGREDRPNIPALKGIKVKDPETGEEKEIEPCWYVTAKDGVSGLPEDGMAAEEIYKWLLKQIECPMCGGTGKKPKDNKKEQKEGQKEQKEEIKEATREGKADRQRSVDEIKRLIRGFHR